MDASEAAKALQITDIREERNVDHPDASRNVKESDQKQSNVTDNATKATDTMPNSSTNGAADTKPNNISIPKDALEILPLAPQHREQAMQLVWDYSVALGVNLTFQNFTEEMQSFPGAYVSNQRGAFLVAVKTNPTTQSLKSPVITSARQVQSLTDESPSRSSERTAQDNVIGVVGLRAFKGFAGSTYSQKGIKGDTAEVDGVSDTKVEVTDMQGNAIDDPLSAPAPPSQALSKLPPIDGMKQAEIKRLYVSPDARGTGAGKKMLISIIDEAKKLGYTSVWLDTIPRLVEANKLYERLGFELIDGINDLEGPGRLFYMKKI